MIESSRKLILHIGSHKTGSTSLQKFLFKKKRELKKIGWNYFSSDPDGCVNVEGNANKWVNFFGKKNTMEAAVNLGLVDELKKKDGNWIVSAEELSWISDQGHLLELSEKLSDIFNEIMVVVYFRRQDLHLLSHYHQGFRFYESSAARFYGRSSTALPKYQEYFDDYLDYNKKFEKWAHAFGKDNLKVGIFEKERLINGDVITDFINKTDLGLDVEDLKINVNESLNKLEILYNYYSFQSGIALPYPIDFTNYSDSKFLPSISEAESIYFRYKKSNNKLFDRLDGNLKFCDHKFPYPIEANSQSDSDVSDIIALMNSNITLKKIIRFEASKIIRSSFLHRILYRVKGWYYASCR